MKKQKIKQTKVVINSKIKNWLLRHTITVFSCVLIIALGITALTYADPVTTTIGENISTNDLSVAGNITSGTWQGSEIQDAYIADDITASNYLPLTGGDLTGDLSTTGSITSGTWQGSAVGTQYGGTGQDWSAIIQGNIPYFSDTGTLSNLAPGTAGQFLKSQGAGADPTWDNVTRSATFVVCANDSLNKTQCDYVCDGVDDQVEIQAAIDALTSGRTNKEKIICIGNFTLGANINLPSYTILELQGSMKAKDSFGYPALIVVSWHSQQWEIHGGEFDGNKANVTANVSGIIVRASTIEMEYHDPFGIIRNVNVKNCTQDGFEISSRRTHLLDCVSVDNNRYGYYVAASDGLYIGCSSILNGDDGFRVEQAHNHFVDCFSDRDSGDGFDIRQHDNVIIGGYAEWVDGVGVKMGVSDAYSTTIKDMRIISNTGYGIYVSSDYNIIDGNRIYDLQGTPTQNWGVYVYNGNKNTISNNNVVDNPNKIYDNGTNTIITHDIGFTTENSGTATLANGTTSITVNHGLDVTPSDGDIIVTPTGAWGAMTKFWVGGYTSTQFTIYADQDPGQNVTFAWKAAAL